ncbi:MAG TPA: hypothetical protein VM686_37665, partial [Polyangiaceae bacterium]|nr:hypothetical protein [Polyangiaceae bacterium]
MIAIGVAACAGLIWLVAGGATSSPDTVAELPQARPVAALSPSPAPASPAPTVVAANSDSARLVDSFKAALADAPATPDTPSTIPVTVHVSPSDALIFKSERCLGKGNVTINVVPGGKINLIARRDGYTPRTMVVDG